MNLVPRQRMKADHLMMMIAASTPLPKKAEARKTNHLANTRTKDARALTLAVAVHANTRIVAAGISNF